jgi:hypothetical protein
MKLTKAIVLTYDRHRSLTDHMIFCYEKLWPKHPYIFQVPYQEIPPTLQSSRVQYHKCPADIKGTVLTLLDALDDEEMIYWCIDDKYPIWLDIKKIKKIHQWLSPTDGKDIGGLLFCRCRGMLSRQNLTDKEVIDDQGDICLERKNYEQIWIHQYLKVKVIRHLFNSFPNRIPAAESMDVFKGLVEKPNSHHLYVTGNNLATFGESTSQGVIMKNCFESMKANNLCIPSWASETTSHEVTMGTEPRKSVSHILDRLIRHFR